jgi:hypothetical protein
MKLKNGFPLLLALSIIFASVPVAVHAAQQKDVPPQPAQATQPAPPQPNPSDQRDARQTITGPYRITYTLTEMDGTKRVGSKRYAIVLDSGEESPSAQLKLGSKVPLETGELQGNSASQTISYVDVGLIIEANLRSFANGHELRSQVSQSEVDTQQSLTKDPVIRETDFKSAVLLQENKPVIIGNVDMLGSTHFLQIQVELSKLP